MNWLIIGPLSKPHHTAWSIIRALHSLEEEVFAIESRQWNAQTTAQLAISTIKSRKIQYILLVDAIPEIFEIIKNSKDYVKIFWSFDFDTKFYHRIGLTASLSDFFFSMSSKFVTDFSHLCKNSFFMPQAADHFLYKLSETITDKKYNISFIGSNKLGRIKILTPLTQFNLHVFGEYWTRKYLFSFPVHEAVYGSDFNETCSNSKILLNLSTYEQFSTPKKTISQRVFMIMATKSFCLTEPVEELDYFFDNNEIGILNNIEDAKYYLDNDKKREEITENGYRRTLQCHTYIHRMTEMMKILK